MICLRKLKDLTQNCFREKLKSNCKMAVINLRDKVSSKPWQPISKF